MKIIFIGTKHNSEDVKDGFINNSIVSLCESPNAKPAYHDVLKSATFGDIVVLKTTSYTKIHIHAIGVVENPNYRYISDKFKYGISVDWKILFDEPIIIAQQDDGYKHMRTFAIYTEPSNYIQKKILDLLIHHNKVQLNCINRRITNALNRANKKVYQDNKDSLVDDLIHTLEKLKNQMKTMVH